MTKADKKAQAIEFIADCPLKRLKPYQRNPRKNDPAVDAVAKSIEKFGAVAPIIVNGDFEICAGHTRFKAATQIGRETFPVIVVPTLTGDDFIGYNIADNQTASIAEFDDKALATLIQELDWSDFDLDALGFDDDELRRVMASLEQGGQTDPDDVPEVPKIAVSKPGDLWLCGNHRLLCGDATKKKDVERLMGGAKAGCVLTDPPYGISIVKVSKGRASVGGAKAFGTVVGKSKSIAPHNYYIAIEGDDKPFDPTHLLTLAPAVALFGGNYFADKLPRSAGWICWDKRENEMERNCFAECELIWTNQPRPALVFRHQWMGLMKASERGESRVHPTQKPIALMAALVAEFEGDVLDPYLGSGTTMIACEQLGRKCYGMEIEPIYVDVAVKRWENFTGKKATLESTGEEFPKQEAA